MSIADKSQESPVTPLAFKRAMNKIFRLQADARKEGRVFEYQETVTRLAKVVKRCGGILQALKLAEGVFDGEVPEILWNELETAETTTRAKREKL